MQGDTYLSEQNQYGPESGKHQNHLTVKIVLYYFHQPYPYEQAYQYPGNQFEVYPKRIQTYGLPNKNVKRQLKNIDNKEKPSGRTYKLVFGQSHRQEKDIAERPGQIADHGGDTRHNAHRSRKGPMRRYAFRLFPVPPVHHNHTAQDDDDHAQFKGAFVQILSDQNPDQDPQHHPR